MKLLLWAAIILGAFLLQSTVSVLDVPPNLTVLIVYYLGIRYGETKGMLSGMTIGFIEDSLALSIIGPHLLSKGIIGFLSSRLISGSVLRWTPLLGIFTLIGLTAIDNSLVFMSKALFDKLPAEPSRVIYTTVLQAFLNAPAGIFIKPPHAD